MTNEGNWNKAEAPKNEGVESHGKFDFVDTMKNNLSDSIIHIHDPLPPVGIETDHQNSGTSGLPRLELHNNVEALEAQKLATALEQNNSLKDSDGYLKNLPERNPEEIDRILKLANEDLKKDGSELQLELKSEHWNTGRPLDSGFFVNYDLTLTDGGEKIDTDKWDKRDPFIMD